MPNPQPDPQHPTDAKLRRRLAGLSIYPPTLVIILIAALVLVLLGAFFTITIIPLISSACFILGVGSLLLTVLLNRRDQQNRQITQDLLSSENRLSLVVESIQDYAILMVDKHGVIATWNKGVEAIKGYSADEIIGQPMSIFYTGEDQKNGEPERNLGMARTLGRHYSEGWRVRKDGTRFWADIVFTALYNAQGELKGFAKVTRDRTELKRSQEQMGYLARELERLVLQKSTELLTVFERISDGVMAYNNAGDITYVNKKAAEMNRRPPEDIIGQNFWTLFPSAVHNAFGENFRRAIDTQQNAHFEMFSPSLQLWIECYMYPSTDGLSLFFRDISEKIAAREAISRSYDELRQLASHLQNIREEERATMAREIHDELGQQLTGIKMDMVWIKRKWDKPADDPLEQKMTEALGLLDNTIKTVRRIATDLRPSVLDDLGLIAAIEWQSQEFTRRSGIDVLFQSPAGEINFEPSISIGLFRICQESLTNVARHAGAKKVWIDLERIDDTLKLSIRDDGSGLKNGGTEKKTLGLLGMKERALMMGGRLEIKSEDGHGLRLEVIVPLKPIMVDN
jgi:PAS domain S-box-containing protein